MIEIRNISKSYRKKVVLTDISFRLDNGIHALLGANGSGKTTLLRILAGTLPPSAGGELILPSSHDIGYLPQKFGCFPDLTVREQLMYFASLKEIAADCQREEIERALSAVNLNDKQNMKCRKLSGGMIRRVGIAQALLGDPKLLLFDEPTTGLDPEERQRFYTLLTARKENCTILISTHIIADMERLCSSVIFLKNGKVVME